jgi:hypothetical protein
MSVNQKTVSQQRQTSIRILAGMFVALLPTILNAQGTVYLSNLAEPTSGSAPVARDSWAAAFFRTGTNAAGYLVNSVQLLMSSGDGNPSGLVVSIYSYNNRFPVSSLGVLTGLDPVGGGTFLYSTPGIVLSSSTSYFLVLASATPIAQGSFAWNTATTGGYDSSEGWSIGFGGTGLNYWKSADGINWVGGGSPASSPQFAINSTRAPEPSASGLLTLGLALLAFRKFKRTPAQYP